MVKKQKRHIRTSKRGKKFVAGSKKRARPCQINQSMKRQIVQDYMSQTQIELKRKVESIFSELRRTKKFLESENIVTIKKIKEKIDNLSLIRWITVGKISPYYAILSPFIKKALDGKKIEEIFLLDLSVYRRSISKEVEEWFARKFQHEFKLPPQEIL